MSLTPYRDTLRVYKANTFSYSFTFEEDGSALDLTTLTNITVRYFNKNTTVFEHDVLGGDLTISGAGNKIISGTATDEVMDIAKRSYDMEVIFDNNGAITTYVALDAKVVDAESSNSTTAASFEVSITSATGSIGGQPTVLYAETIEAKNAAEAAQQAAETAESNAETSATNASNSADSASTSATNASNSADAAAQSETDAEAARDEIVGVLSNEIKRRYIYDSFERANSASLGTSDSGHAWIDLIGDGFSVNSNTAYANTAGNISVIERTNFGVEVTDSTRGGGDVTVGGSFQTRLSTQRVGLVIAKDSNNYIIGYFSFVGSSTSTGIISVVSGSETTESSTILPAVYRDNIDGSLVEAELSLITSNGSSSRAAIFKLPSLDTIVTADISTLGLFEDFNDPLYIGIYSGDSINTSFIDNFYSKNLSV